MAMMDIVAVTWVICGFMEDACHRMIKSSHEEDKELLPNDGNSLD